MLGLGRLCGTAAARRHRQALSLRPPRAPPQRPAHHRLQSTKPEPKPEPEAAAEAAEPAAETAQQAMDRVLSMENLMKVAVFVPSLAPTLYFIGQGMQEKAFLNEVEEWARDEKYQHTETEHAAAKDCMQYIMLGQIAGLAAGGVVGWAMAGLRAIPICITAMLGGQVGKVYPTQITTTSLLTVPDSSLAAQARRILVQGTKDHHKSLRERHADALRKAEKSARRHRGAFRNE